MKIKNEILEKIILDIENSDFQNIEEKSEDETFELWSDPALLENLSGNIGAFFVRACLNKLKVNEHHVFRWRLENKYRQYQIFNHYLPGFVAETISFSQILNTNNGIQKIRELCANGYFIKATLGQRSGQSNSFDKTDELDDIIKFHQDEYGDPEKWMLQKRLDLKEEFRVHTFGKDLLYGLIFIMKGRDRSKSTGVEIFVEGILRKLPDTILQGTLIGWDIGITDTDEYYVIEANFTGFHPEFARGFQTSGYFGDNYYGSIMCAWLNNYFRIKYHVSIDSVEDSLLSDNDFYKEFMYYNSLIKEQHIEFIRNRTGKAGIAAILYLGDEINPLLVKLIKYFQEENFADVYYLIINGEHILTIGNLFAGNTHVRVFIEDKLFTKEDNYDIIKQLSHEKRKKICSNHALQMIKEEFSFVV